MLFQIVNLLIALIEYPFSMMENKKIHFGVAFLLLIIATRMKSDLNGAQLKTILQVGGWFSLWLDCMIVEFYSKTSN
jgi:hypothetical protein